MQKSTHRVDAEGWDSSNGHDARTRGNRRAVRAGIEPVADTHTHTTYQGLLVDVCT